MATDLILFGFSGFRSRRFAVLYTKSPASENRRIQNLSLAPAERFLPEPAVNSLIQQISPEENSYIKRLTLTAVDRPIIRRAVRQLVVRVP